MCSFFQHDLYKPCLKSYLQQYDRIIQYKHDKCCMYNMESWYYVKCMGIKIEIKHFYIVELDFYVSYLYRNIKCTKVLSI
jgi:hypothetical protein